MQVHLFPCFIRINIKLLMLWIHPIGNRMFLGMQYFDFVQIQSNLPKSNHFCPNFSSVLSKFFLNPNQICPNLINLAPKKFARVCGCTSSSYGTVWSLKHFLFVVLSYKICQLRSCNNLVCG